MKNLGFRKVLVNIGFLNPELEKDIYICKKMGVKWRKSQKIFKRNWEKILDENENKD